MITPVSVDAGLPLRDLTRTGWETSFDAYAFGSAEAHMLALCCAAVFVNSRVSCESSRS